MKLTDDWLNANIDSLYKCFKKTEIGSTCKSKSIKNNVTKDPHQIEYFEKLELKDFLSDKVQRWIINKHNKKR